ncbi:MAG TPA: hypothetical protein VG651_21170 [Stellaceae bacterium]|nr:hypothetical protein [Stellaceae bacterium]
MHAHRLDACKTAPETIKTIKTTVTGMTNPWDRLAHGLRCRHSVDARARSA